MNDITPIPPTSGFLKWNQRLTEGDSQPLKAPAWSKNALAQMPLQKNAKKRPRTEARVLLAEQGLH